MKQMIHALRQLQLVDNEIRGLAAERDDLGSHIGQLETLHERGATALAEKRAKLADVESFYRERNDQLKANLEKAARSKNKLREVRNTREHEAVNEELKSLARSNAQQEEEILKLLEAIDGYKKGIGEDEARLATLATELDGARAESADRLSALDAKITSIGGRKQTIAEALPKGLLRKYERTLAARDGMAVVEVVSGTCTGCNMQIPPQQFIELQRMENLMNCPNCQRFIFVACDELVGVEAEEPGEALRLAN